MTFADKPFYCGVVLVTLMETYNLIPEQFDRSSKYRNWTDQQSLISLGGNFSSALTAARDRHRKGAEY